MKIGLLVEVEEGLTWSRWLAVLARAEALGLDSVWLSDHLCSPWSPTQRGLESWTALAVGIAETRRVLLGPLVSPVTFRQPAVMARMAEALQTLSGGRFTLGLGLGWNRAEHDAFGIPFPAISERARLLEQTAGLIADVPLLIGGGGERWTLPLVARYAREWNLTTASSERVAERAAVLAGLCADIGRDPSDIVRSVAVGYLIGRDHAELHDRARRLQAWVEPFARVAVEEVPRVARDMGWLVGTPEQVLAATRELGQVGVQRVMLGHYDLEDLSALDVLAEEVMPGLA